MLEVLENLETWKKWTGGTTIVVLVLLSFLYFSGEKEAVELPSTINEIKKNISEEVLKVGIETSKESSNEIIGAFRETGKALAKDVDDPLLKIEIVGLMTFAGILLALYVVLMIMIPILKLVGVKIK